MKVFTGFAELVETTSVDMMAGSLMRDLRSTENSKICLCGVVLLGHKKKTGFWCLRFEKTSGQKMGSTISSYMC